MKKISAFILALALSLSLTACSRNNNANEPENTTAETTTAETTVLTEETTLNNTDDTLGQVLYSDFMRKVEENPSIDVLTLAEEIVANPAIKFAPVTMEIETGYLAGFTEEIGGFKSGATFAPMIGSIPFVGYIFELENESDAEAFMKTLSEKSDMAWNVCVEAEETVVGNVGTKVFFVMCPSSMEE